jgi:hypothetical protein
MSIAILAVLCVEINRIHREAVAVQVDRFMPFTIWAVIFIVTMLSCRIFFCEVNET